MNNILEFYRPGKGGGKVVRSLNRLFEECKALNPNVKFIAQCGRSHTFGFETLPDYYREYLGFYSAGEAIYSLSSVAKWGDIPGYRRIYPIPESYVQTDSKLP